ncbi:DUF1992 domain-containing protein [Nocardioides seonyuensis]|uniref:DUF1992 domain-containing protein n=1 Tax=Nocardioides seonyuensis TaxID=2518371 RepID=A0A4P7IEN2_9ACTN|nr:DUF1992 domain-containing protein [Nocardioides seonyuensis]QBX55709.1 DUF1992 domain-containing protein [Nocardioides seonyuensis]
MTDEQRQAPDREPARDTRTGGSAAAARIQHQTQWVEQQLRVAFERGDFDDLPGYGKPLEGLGAEHDPDWWVKKLIEREQVTGVLPPALALRKEDAELDSTLDRLNVEAEVRRELEEFNRRVVEVRRQLQGGPPVITPTRDVDAEVAAWRERRTARVEAQRAALARQQADQPSRRRRGLFRRRD